MIRKMICIECPNGCVLQVNTDTSPIGVTGNKCPKGLSYALSEIEDPRRILTSSVLTDGLALKMVSVRTDKPIPKRDLLKAMDEIKAFRLRKPVAVGDVIIKDLLGSGADLVATRDCSRA